MYGLLLENMSDYIITKYGAERWEEIRRLACVEQPSFSVHQVYPENLIPRLSNRAIEVLGVTEREFFEGMGVHFVGFVSQYGYDRVLSVLGRHMRDFLNGLDNLHEYLKFSYPRMRAPSFICENETRQGLTLHYRSKRRGFVYYTMGQIKEVARHFYRKEMGIEVVREELLVDTVHVTFQLTFDNRAFGLASLTMTREEKHLPVSASVLFEIFPFCIVFSSDMVVRSIGNSLMVILPDLVGNKITNWFDLVRPLVAFQFQKILNRTNNIFELVTVEPVMTGRPFDRKRSVLLSDESSMDGSEEKNLRLKGQMIYMDDWRMMMYLGTPVMPDLSSLVSTGLYINDLPMHDFSRDLMLAGTQQSVELKLALDQEQHKSKKLEESMRRLDMEMRRTDELLYQMIPKAVADRLRNGENPIDTCQMFNSVSILFADVVTFTEICSRLSPMEVVSMLNGMYSIFDNLTERNKVYKVETIGDAYMVVSGAPEREDNHAEKVCDMALDMLDAIKGLKDPSTGSHLCIRVGVHSGAVVAGIVGLKMPRYCLFGDSVNTASRMESTSEAMRVHVSQPTRDLLPACYQLVERGEVQVKGKGSMKTYWLEGREHDARAVQEPHTDEEEDVREEPPQPEDAVKEAEMEDDRSVYSPVTFQEIAKRSLASSPKRAAAGRSNSTGSVQQLPSSPAEFVSARVLDPQSLDFGPPLPPLLPCSPSGRLVGVAVGSSSQCGLLAAASARASSAGPGLEGQPAQRRPSWNPPLQVTSPPTTPSSKGSPSQQSRGSLGNLGSLGSMGNMGAIGVLMGGALGATAVSSRAHGVNRKGSLSVHYSPHPVDDEGSTFEWGHPAEGDPYGMKVRPGSRRASIASTAPPRPASPWPATPCPAPTAPPAPPSPPAPPPRPLEVRTLVHCATQASPDIACHSTSPILAAKAEVLAVQTTQPHWFCLQMAMAESSEAGSGLSVVLPPGSESLSALSPCLSPGLSPGPTSPLRTISPCPSTASSDAGDAPEAPGRRAASSPPAASAPRAGVGGAASSSGIAADSRHGALTAVASRGQAAATGTSREAVVQASVRTSMRASMRTSASEGSLLSSPGRRPHAHHGHVPHGAHGVHGHHQRSARQARQSRQRLPRSHSHHQHFHHHHHHHHACCGPPGSAQSAQSAQGAQSSLGTANNNNLPNAAPPRSPIRHAGPRRSKSTGCAVT